MSTLSAFLRPVKTTIEKEVVISDRFVGDDGKPVLPPRRATKTASAWSAWTLWSTPSA